MTAPLPRKVKVSYEVILDYFRPGYMATGTVFVNRSLGAAGIETAIRNHICNRFRCNRADIYHLGMDYPGLWDN